MGMHVHAHALPSLVPPGCLHASTAVVIDLLRASTTICHAMQAGATRVVPVLEVADALRARESLHGQPSVLGGERHGRRIDGFDLGNSPGEYTPSSVSGKVVIFTTTNGTRAALACRDAREVLIGCFANLSAVGEACLRARGDVHLVCAGTGGVPALEDCLFAGALADRLVEHGLGVGNDQAELMLEAWRGVMRSPAGIADALVRSRGGVNLASIGLTGDIDVCAEVDSCVVVPRLDADGAFV
jgi:2-phosphosulfolactate phosphatase